MYWISALVSAINNSVCLFSCATNLLNSEEAFICLYESRLWGIYESNKLLVSGLHQLTLCACLDPIPPGVRSSKSCWTPISMSFWSLYSQQEKESFLPVVVEMPLRTKPWDEHQSLHHGSWPTWWSQNVVSLWNSVQLPVPVKTLDWKPQKRCGHRPLLFPHLEKEHSRLVASVFVFAQRPRHPTGLTSQAYTCRMDTCAKYSSPRPNMADSARLPRSRVFLGKTTCWESDHGILGYTLEHFTHYSSSLFVPNSLAPSPTCMWCAIYLIHHTNLGLISGLTSPRWVLAEWPGPD